MISSIKLKEISKQYGPAQFTLNVDELEFHNQHIQVIVGPNGSGKSTLLNIIAFLERPDSGNIFVNGKEVFPGNGHDHLRKKIGFIRQSPYLFDLDVAENIALGLKIRKRPQDEITVKVNDILGTLNIEHLRKRRVKSLSRGEYQKVAIAQVFVLEPKVILMDEPAANIDAPSTLFIEETLKNLQKKMDSIVVMTTHSLTQAYRMSPDIISIREGRVVDFVHENVFSGQIKEATGGLQCMKVCKGVEIVFSTEKKDRGYIAIDPGNIIISKNAVKTSARNTFMGKVIKTEVLGANVRVVIDIGIHMYVIITKQSFKEMNINLGSPVVLSFKVNSVRAI
ncbi:MAG: ABC transporter ATP-binding protein [Candidatus Omnitrophota bacterium]